MLEPFLKAFGQITREARRVARGFAVSPDGIELDGVSWWERGPELVSPRRSSQTAGQFVVTTHEGEPR